MEWWIQKGGSLQDPDPISDSKSWALAVMSGYAAWQSRRSSGLVPSTGIQVPQKQTVSSPATCILFSIVGSTCDHIAFIIIKVTHYTVSFNKFVMIFVIWHLYITGTEFVICTKLIQCWAILVDVAHHWTNVVHRVISPSCSHDDSLMLMQLS